MVLDQFVFPEIIADSAELLGMASLPWQHVGQSMITPCVDSAGSFRY